MITFIIAIKDDPEIDLATLEFQIASCLRVHDGRVLVGLSADAHDHFKTWTARPPFMDARVTLTITDDNGLYEGWNALVSAASTPWVSFLGFGDIVMQPEHFIAIGKMTQITQGTPQINAVFSRVVILSPEHNRFFGRPFRLWQHKIKQGVAFIGAVFDRALILSMPFDTSYRIVGDYEWLSRSGPRITATFLPIVSVAMKAGGMSEALVPQIRAELKRAKKSA